MPWGPAEVFSDLPDRSDPSGASDLSYPLNISDSGVTRDARRP